MINIRSELNNIRQEITIMNTTITINIQNSITVQLTIIREKMIRTEIKRNNN